MTTATSSRQALVFVAHGDDESVGCGGYIPLLVERGYRVVLVIGSCARFQRKGQDVDNRAHTEAAATVLGIHEVHFLEMEEQRFESYRTMEITGELEALGLDPELILTHSGQDLNRDHRVIHEMALLYARPVIRRTRVLACEVINNAEFHADNFRANFYVDVTRTIEVKKKAFSCYVNEARQFPHPYSEGAIEIKAHQRGMEAGLAFAEAYQVLRWFD